MRETSVVLPGPEWGGHTVGISCGPGKIFWGQKGPAITYRGGAAQREVRD